MPNTSGAYKYARKLISTATLAAGAGAIIKNTVPFQLGVINGSTSGGCRYGYFSNFSVYQPDVSVSNNATVCATSNTTAMLSTSFVGTAYQWNRNGTAISGANGSSYVATAAGTYNVDVIYDAQCSQVRSGDIIVTSSCSLPLHFTSFEAKTVSGKSVLQWFTENEANVSYFEIERSSDGLNYTKIGNMKAKNLPTNNQYSYTDLAPLDGINFYRIKQVDNTTVFTYSSVVRLKSEPGSDLAFYPNPVSDRLVLQPHLTGVQLTLSIYDASGLMIQNKKILNQPMITIPVNRLASGSYLMELSNGTLKQRAQFIKR